MKSTIEQPELRLAKYGFAWRSKMPSSNLLKLILLLAIGFGALLILGKTHRNTLLTLAETRPIVQVAALLLGLVALWGLGKSATTALKHPRRFAWRMSLRLVGWIGFAVSIGGAFALMIQPNDAPGIPIGGALRAVESMIPLVIGIHAAFLLSPDDEPGLEVLLACPRRISWVLLERLALVLLIQAGIALLATLVSMSITGERDLLLVVARWIAPAVFFGGLSVYTTLASRYPAFSVAVVGIVWFVFKFVGEALLPGQPAMWPLNLVQPFVWSINPYLQPLDLTLSDWWLNRILVSAVGIVFMWLTVRELLDEERVLLGGAKARKPARGEA